MDIGMDRVQMYDQVRGMSVTELRWISQSQANQRAGRSGRTGVGKCYRLFSMEQWEMMDRHKVSDMRRLNLDIVVLRLKQFGCRDVREFRFIEKPADEALEKSEEYLSLISK